MMTTQPVVATTVQPPKEETQQPKKWGRKPFYGREKTTNEITLKIPLHVFVLMNEYTQEAAGEVSAMGMIETTEEGVFTLEELHFPEQEVSRSHTKMLDEGLFAIMRAVKASGGSPSNLRFWFHSHADMEPFWSPTDERTIGNFGEIGAPWAVSLVTSRNRGDYIARLDIFQPFRWTFHNVRVQVLLGEPMQAWAQEKAIQDISELTIAMDTPTEIDAEIYPPYVYPEPYVLVNPEEDENAN